MTAGEIKIKKKTLFFIIFALIIISIIVLYLSYIQPKGEQKTEIQEYKKALYEGILCQHSCPVINATLSLNNETILTPDRECINACIAVLKEKYPDTSQFTTEQLTDDSLLGEMDKLLRDCAEENTDEENSTDRVLSSACSAEKLEKLKENYSYLN